MSISPEVAYLPTQNYFLDATAEVVELRFAQISKSSTIDVILVTLRNNLVPYNFCWNFFNSVKLKEIY